MMRIFYGAAIQGEKNRGEREYIHRELIEFIESNGYRVFCKHTTGKTREETAHFLEEALGQLSPKGKERTIFVRRKMIEAIEGDICAAIFELSTPSIGTGIEIAHAYLRPRLNLPSIPILAVYQEGFWPNGLTSMISGLTQIEFPQFY